MKSNYPLSNLLKKRFVLNYLLVIISLATSAQVTFQNNTSITLPDDYNLPILSDPFPASITVSGLDGTVSYVTVSIYGFTHPFPAAVDMLLVAPDGTNATIFSDVGGAFDTQNLTFVLDDAASSSLPNNSILESGTFKPSNYGANDSWPAPAPAPSKKTPLSTFKGILPNGNWNLYIVNDADGATGYITGGWSLTLLTSEMSLPVTFSNIKAAYNAEKKHTKLYWETAQEFNSKSFNVERSADGGKTWKTIGKKDAAGNSNMLRTYNFVDEAPLEGANFYRLKQIDLDNTFNFSKIVSVTATKTNNGVYSVYPNPAVNTTYIRSGNAEPEMATITLTDLNGKIIQKAQGILGKNNPFAVNLSQINAGVYFVHISTSTKEFTQKLAVSHK